MKRRERRGVDGIGSFPVLDILDLGPDVEEIQRTSVRSRPFPGGEGEFRPALGRKGQKLGEILHPHPQPGAAAGRLFSPLPGFFLSPVFLPAGPALGEILLRDVPGDAVFRPDDA